MISPAGTLQFNSLKKKQSEQFKLYRGLTGNLYLLENSRVLLSTMVERTSRHSGQLFVCLFVWFQSPEVNIVGEEMGSQLQGSKDCMSVYYENNRSELVKDASTCTAVPKNPWDCRCYSVSGFFLTNRQTFGETRQGWPIFWTNWGRGKSAGEYDGNFPEGLQGFQGPLLILHKVERLCRPMEREGGNLRGNTRRILLRRFQGPSSFKTMTNGGRG